MANETDEYIQMNDAYKKRIVKTLRDPMSAGAQIGDVAAQDAGAKSQVPQTGIGPVDFTPKDEKVTDRYSNSLRGRLSDAMSKYLGPKDPTQ